MTNMGGVGSSWMGGKILPIIQLSCLRPSGGQVSAHLGEPWAGGGDLGHRPGVMMAGTSFLNVQKK
ncbi:hypothetical protein Hanom_Chr04g00312851 [Helianthus anomalus]